MNSLPVPGRWTTALAAAAVAFTFVVIPVEPSGAVTQDPAAPQADPTPKPCAPPSAGATDPSSGKAKPDCQSNGVITPPPIKDQGVLPPPDVNPKSMPVIPPPGTPGGNPNVKPQ